MLNVARDPAYQFPPGEAEPVLLTQSDTAIGYSGRSADTRKTWLDLIVFDEYRMTAAPQVLLLHRRAGHHRSEPAGAPLVPCRARASSSTASSSSIPRS